MIQPAFRQGSEAGEAGLRDLHIRQIGDARTPHLAVLGPAATLPALPLSARRVELALTELVPAPEAAADVRVGPLARALPATVLLETEELIAQRLELREHLEREVRVLVGLVVEVDPLGHGRVLVLEIVGLRSGDVHGRRVRHLVVPHGVQLLEEAGEVSIVLADVGVLAGSLVGTEHVSDDLVGHHQVATSSTGDNGSVIEEDQLSGHVDSLVQVKEVVE